MNKRTRISKAVAAAFLAASAQLAFAVDEVEPNNEMLKAQQLVIGSDGSAIVQGALGATLQEEPFVSDTDYYSFVGRAGDAVTLDIDGGVKIGEPEKRNVDTKIILYRPVTVNTWEVHVENDDSLTIDEGSASIGGDRDSRLDDPPVALPVDGTYIVAVTWSPVARQQFWNGSYTLIINGVTAPRGMDYVNIDIKPGDRNEVTQLNPKQKRDIPIAILSRKAKGDVPAFDALKADVKSITFGRTGTENSLTRCLGPKDVNHDRLPDLVCLFDVPSAGFEEDDVAGKLKGRTVEGSSFEAVGKLKVQPTRSRKDQDRPEYRPHHGWHHGHRHGRDDDRHDGKHHGHDRDDDRRGGR